MCSLVQKTVTVSHLSNSFSTKQSVAPRDTCFLALGRKVRPADVLKPTNAMDCATWPISFYALHSLKDRRKQIKSGGLVFPVGWPVEGRARVCVWRLAWSRSSVCWGWVWVTGSLVCSAVAPPTDPLGRHCCFSLSGSRSLFLHLLTQLV